MIEVDTLDALDLSLWFQGSLEVARVTGCSASTISRRLHQALDCFALRLQRGPEGLALAGDCTLIGMQRTVHQFHRLMGGRPLRLHLLPWSRQLIDPVQPEGWLLNPRGELHNGNPLGLLRERVIDACVVTPTQLTEASSGEFSCFELYTSWIQLHGHSLDSDQPLPADARGEDLLTRAPLEPPPFLPHSCREASFARHQLLLDVKAVPRRRNRRAPWRLCYLTPEMATLLPQARPLPHRLEWPYREQLVVLTAHREHPRVLTLLEHLRSQLDGVRQPLCADGSLEPTCSP